MKKTVFQFLILALLISLPACSPAVVSPDTSDIQQPSTAVMEEQSPADTVTEEQAVSTPAYNLVETGQGFCYSADGERIACPAEDEAFYGQDAQFTGNPFSYTDNDDGTITDHVTGLIWQQTPDGTSYSWDQAQSYCESLTLGGQDDWRMPSLKELFSISNFSAGWPYLDLAYFNLVATDSLSKDEQYWADNYYVGQTAEGGYDAAFGVNHATGHIKAYPALVTGPMGKYVRCVQGEEYLVNDFVDNGDGTITDNATGMMWSQADSGEGMDWEAALAYAVEMNDANYLGYSDWRLPNIKELQSIVDYDYAPDASDEAFNGPALDPMFEVSGIINEADEPDYPYYWTSTSARFSSGEDFYYAWYVAAGRAVNNEGVDFHGAGAVRFDTKAEDGPAGEDVERYHNYVRLVRGGDATLTPDGDPDASDTSAMQPSASNAPNGDGGPQGAGRPDGQQMPDFSAAAETLGITEADLMAALGDLNQGPPDLAAAAQTLGISEEELADALGVAP